MNISPAISSRLGRGNVWQEKERYGHPRVVATYAKRSQPSRCAAGDTNRPADGEPAPQVGPRARPADRALPPAEELQALVKKTLGDPPRRWAAILSKEGFKG